MDATGLAGYRKFIGVLVMGALMFSMNRFGIQSSDLTAIGISVNEVQTGILDFLMQIGIPAVVGVLAQPNEIGQSLLQNWRWIVGGLAGVAATGAAAYAIAAVF